MLESTHWCLASFAACALVLTSAWAWFCISKKDKHFPVLGSAFLVSSFP